MTQSDRKGFSEYQFSLAWGDLRPNLATIIKLNGENPAGNPQTEVGKEYAAHFGVGVEWFLIPQNWSTYTCTQTELSFFLNE